MVFEDSWLRRAAKGFFDCGAYGSPRYMRRLGRRTGLCEPPHRENSSSSEIKDMCWHKGQVAREVYVSYSQHGWGAAAEEVRTFAFVLFKPRLATPSTG